MQHDYSFGNLDDAPERNYDPIPAGNYMLRAVEMEMRATKSGTGHYLNVGFEIVAGAHEGRRFYQNFNLVNQNQQAVDIALRDVKDWLQACAQPNNGQLTMQRINALEGLVFSANVKIKKDKSGQYDPSNEIGRFLPPEKAPAPAMQNAPAPTPQNNTAQAPDSSGAKMPWQ